MHTRCIAYAARRQEQVRRTGRQHLDNAAHLAHQNIEVAVVFVHLDALQVRVGATCVVHAARVDVQDQGGALKLQVLDIRS